MLVIGLTGGIGAGKSEVARLLTGHGAVIIDTALLGHEAYAPGPWSGERSSRHLGEISSFQDIQIDRKILGDIVFADPTALDSSTPSRVPPSAT